MSADAQLRKRFERAADHVSVDVGRQLDRAHGEVGRRRRARRVRALAVAAAVGIVAVVVAWQLPFREGAAPFAGVPAGRIAYLDTSGTIKSVGVATGEMSTVLRGNGSWAAWSPDGSRLAYIVNEPEPGLRSMIVVADADGSDPVTILDEPKDPTMPGPDLLNLSWSPDGTRIAYTGRAVGLGRTVLVMNADGSDRVALGGTWFWVSWSPDGERLLVGGFPEAPAEGEGQTDLYTMRLDGSDVQQLTNDAAREYNVASWSPDGSEIVFVSGGDYEQDIYVMDADGSNVRQITDHEGMDGFPVWSPGGEWIAYTTDRDATPEQRAANVEGEWSGLSIYVMRPDGSDLTPILDGGDGTPVPADWTS